MKYEKRIQTIKFTITNRMYKAIIVSLLAKKEIPCKYMITREARHLLRNYGTAFEDLLKISFQDTWSQLKPEAEKIFKELYPEAEYEEVNG